ncbi:MAG TPA: Fur family transcriptional regulator [Candidatus Aminicenantes bacterium]|nr:Fur family transcriptional regulator [Candidatus Aminicenantes bacterium]
MTDPLACLHEHGLKRTPRRLAVIRLFQEQNRRLDALEVHRLLSPVLPKLGLPTVYRILEELREIGLLVRVQGEDQRLHYSLCRSSVRHHHHFVCRRCLKVEEVEYCTFREIRTYIERELNCSCERLTMQIEGLCATCRDAKAAPAAPPQENP